MNTELCTFKFLRFDPLYHIRTTGDWGERHGVKTCLKELRKPDNFSSLNVHGNIVFHPKKK